MSALDRIKSIGGQFRSVKLKEMTEIFKLAAIAITWLCIALLLIYLLWTGSIVRTINALRVSHVEAFGVKLDFNERQNLLIERIKSGKRPGFLANSELIARALKRAELNAGAVRGGRILWIDDHPDNNAEVIDLFSEVGIVVVAVTDDRAMLSLLNSGMQFDVIITDGTRDHDRPRDNGAPLTKCPALFVGRPYYLEEQTLNQYNDNIAQGTGIPSGFRTVEMIANWDADHPASENGLRRSFTQVGGSRVIMFSGSAGENAINPCIRTITNRYEQLFNAVLDVLEQSNEAILPSNAKLPEMDRTPTRK